MREALNGFFLPSSSLLLRLLPSSSSLSADASSEVATTMAMQQPMKTQIVTEPATIDTPKAAAAAGLRRTTQDQTTQTRLYQETRKKFQGNNIGGGHLVRADDVQRAGAGRRRCRCSSMLNRDKITPLTAKLSNSVSAAAVAPVTGRLMGGHA